jgi:hypothetical protein
MMPPRPHHCAHVLAVSVIAATIIGCYPVAEEPVRPNGVPAEAFWVGGADGGVFIRLEPPVAEPSTYSGAIYAENGLVEYEGRFTLEPASSEPFDIQDRQGVAGWDGTRVVLKDGRALVADVK